MNFLISLFEKWEQVGISLAPVKTTFKSQESDVRYVSIILYEKPKSGFRKYIVVGPSRERKWVEETVEPFLFEWKFNGTPTPEKINLNP